MTGTIDDWIDTVLKSLTEWEVRAEHHHNQYGKSYGTMVKLMMEQFIGIVCVFVKYQTEDALGVL